MGKHYKFILIFALFFALWIPAAKAAILTLSTEKDSFNVGDRFEANIKINSDGANVNAVQGTLEYPKDILEIISTDKTGSFVDFWLREPEFSNETGRLVFMGGAFRGISGESLQVLKINFKVKSVGKNDLKITDAAITASDDFGTNVLSGVSGIQIAALPKQESAKTVTLSETPKIIEKLPEVPIISESQNENASFTANILNLIKNPILLAAAFGLAMGTTLGFIVGRKVMIKWVKH
ncbi:hypothetical protein A2567_01215 [Candidatus Azambacteria bacterium RIFOXYD1_FULL_42_11]|uniref:Cohesin domain-containing protein n=4 Tax=Candidatus Azamiibacteriota TaxID=1752741 RepID=A0A0G0ZAK8_9BACT|nr:MAG: hypothetical protein UV07_C0007G0014 [Candidatus Azambacteria bacterium GW2011_GWB1_42_17]KKS45740.1 MAG: hypothetical protein UV10_C0015G0013 [Candidatus Azambacteria bacterium GW2011_GWA1_42_19]KKS75089.1 MAG: hypothetical protein UV48_C0019G0014 [Candidatus Azambacteria bacterium GW2011_GWA2_42_9]KKS88635.1 MAG: hypothetical protein UV62_C0004G0024 [Parcubacteria group bacterium GW2011_GWC1_43_11]OGD42108.1 MAG: hypothetical protein A2567_01215 [Candidatus Azambacteria bacterium RIFO